MIPRLRVVLWALLVAPSLCATTAPQAAPSRAASAPLWHTYRPPAPKALSPALFARPAAEAAPPIPLRKPADIEPRPAIAIVIDDLGHDWPNSARALALPGAVTLAVLPNSPYTQRVAQRAAALDKELMLHAPMEPIAHRAWGGGLHRGMGEDEFRRSIRRMLDQLPSARGVNNHMGSALTQNRQAMDWAMEELAQRRLYFVDSRTSALSQAYAAAQQRALPSLERDIFLDNNREQAAVRRQLQKLIARAKQRGFALAIGHPYPQTLQTLAEEIPRLRAEGVELQPVSRLLEQAQRQAVATVAKARANQ